MPRVVDELTQSSTSILAERRQRRQVFESFRQAQPLALAVKTSDGDSIPAIGERAALPFIAATAGHLPVLSPAGRAGSQF